MCCAFVHYLYIYVLVYDKVNESLYKRFINRAFLCSMSFTTKVTAFLIFFFAVSYNCFMRRYFTKRLRGSLDNIPVLKFGRNTALSLT